MNNNIISEGSNCDSVDNPSQLISAQDWHRADVIAALHKSGTTVVALARASGLSDSSLSNVFYRQWPRGERIIAERLGLSPSLIWPSRYT